MSPDDSALDAYASMTVENWFLTAEERGNPDTDIDRRRGDGRAWTEGNQVEALVHGANYFRRLHAALSSTTPGDWVHFTDWRGDPDERLAGEGTELGPLLRKLASSGVHVRGLLWRSHPHQMRFSEQEAVSLAETVNEVGGEILLDERIRRMGCHHQKLVLIRHPSNEDKDIAFVGGIDLCHGRNDDESHTGDLQPIDLDPRYGPHPPWHDVQLALEGPVIGDLAHTFRERWEDPTPLDHKGPWTRHLKKVAREPRKAGPLPPMPDDPKPRGPHTVQVLRTYPEKGPPFPFARRGERSVARAYRKVLARARRLIYLEDQYLWSEEVADFLADALEASPDLHLIAVVPRFPDQDGRLSGPPNRIGQQAAMDHVQAVGGDRVAVYNIENENGRPIYVHAKVCVIDDTWAAVGSDNLNLRSWTHDSELSCSVLDETRDEREPSDPGGMGDGARVFARELRLQLWREHLGADVAEDVLLDPARGFAEWKARASALEEWHRSGRRGPRPTGRARPHDPGRVQWWAKWWAYPFYRTVVDPDGRPRDLKKAKNF